MTGEELKHLREKAQPTPRELAERRGDGRNTAQGLTQTELANRIGWVGGKATVYMLESGRNRITETTAIAIRAVLS